MTRSVTLLLALLGLALLGRLDRDGMLGRASTAARVLGLEVRIEVKLQRVHTEPTTTCVPTDAAHTVTTAGRPPCE
jgi:hypothetical protein